ncbi:chromate transporter [Siminovitchia sediminis]|uniref:Chromate transporter n=1 Tax=Siminovitchia sediminis TaxID=1274353 RepID=A0ABW4KKW7_9BACI
MLLDIFLTFLLIGFVSFGGGYAILPIIELEVTRHGWMTSQELIDIIAIAGMSPGPIATNTAVFVGFHTMGFPGAVTAAVAVTLPSVLIVLTIAVFFYKINEVPAVQSAFYGLRPIVTALIIFAAYSFAQSNGLFTWTKEAMMGAVVFLFCLFALFRFRWHPALVIFAAGVAGIVVY